MERKKMDKEKKGYGKDGNPSINKRLLAGIVAAGLFVLLGAAALFVLHIQKAKSERETALFQTEMSQATEGQSQEDGQAKDQADVSGGQTGIDGMQENQQATGGEADIQADGQEKEGAGAGET
ncbi:MAG: hypothetical protein K2P65_05315, partial [Lachnospiraceae bacterium]|nr:hypothetical protein [Lachnospiraceae bacterium]